MYSIAEIYFHVFNIVFISQNRQSRWQTAIFRHQNKINEKEEKKQKKSMIWWSVCSISDCIDKPTNFHFDFILDNFLWYNLKMSSIHEYVYVSLDKNVRSLIVWKWTEQKKKKKMHEFINRFNKIHQSSYVPKCNHHSGIWIQWIEVTRKLQNTKMPK